MALAEQVQATDEGLVLAALPDLREVDITERATHSRCQLIAERRQDYIATSIVAAAAIGAVETSVHDAKARVALGVVALYGTVKTLRKWYVKDLTDINNPVR